MSMNSYIKGSILFLAVTSVGMVSGCANYEVNTKRGDIPGHYIRYEMQEADRAVETARQAGKDKSCPAEFKAADDAKNNAYDVFRACRTEEGAALAKKATAKANALCPAKPVVAAPVPKPQPLAPSAMLAIEPASVVAGGSAKMTWSSKNSDDCTIAPAVGKVNTSGSMMIKPSDNTSYTIICSGAGGNAESAAKIDVTKPAPVAVVKPVAVPARVCEPMIINVQFDTNKADIKPVYHDELKKLAEFLKEFPTAKGNIEGHTDSVGSQASNIKLSQRRADSVRNYLIKNFGVSPDRFGAKGFGPAKPIADNSTAAGKQKNRRIEANFNCDKK